MGSVVTTKLSAAVAVVQAASSEQPWPNKLPCCMQAKSLGWQLAAAILAVGGAVSSSLVVFGTTSPPVMSFPNRKLVESMCFWRMCCLIRAGTSYFCPKRDDF